MVSPVEIVNVAKAALPDWIGKVRGLRVEEVVPPELGNLWHVTLSYLEPSDRPEHRLLSQLASLSDPGERVMRVVVVDGESLKAVALIKRDPTRFERF